MMQTQSNKDFGEQLRQVFSNASPEQINSGNFINVGCMMPYDVLGYSKQQNQKMYQVGEQHPDRDAQFRYINEMTSVFLDNGEPVISIDAKKRKI